MIIVYSTDLFLDLWSVPGSPSLVSKLDQHSFKVQTGDPTGTGAGGESYWGQPFRDEHDIKGAATHDSRGILAMANKGSATNG
jgi:hypothetical protein